MIDQGVLSAQSVIFAFLIMRLGDAAAVGRFALSLSTFFIFLAVQNALIGTPLVTRVFGRPADVQARILRVVCTFDIYIIAAAILAGSILLAVVGFNTVEVTVATAMGVS